MNSRFNIAGIFVILICCFDSVSVNAVETNISGIVSQEIQVTDKVVAKGNGFEVKRSELNSAMLAIKSAAAAQNKIIAPEKLLSIESQMLKRLIQIQVLLQIATDIDKTNGIQKGNLAIDNLLAKAGSRDELERQLKAVDMTRDELQTKVIQEATATTVLTRQLGISISDNEAKNFYDKHPADFESPDKALKIEFENVKAKIKSFLAQQQMAKLSPPYLSKLEKAAHVQILDADLMQALLATDNSGTSHQSWGQLIQGTANSLNSSLNQYQMNQLQRQQFQQQQQINNLQHP